MRKFKMLLVDDEADLLEIVQHEVEAQLPDVQVLVADTGPKAIQLLPVADFVLTDRKLPGYDQWRTAYKAAQKPTAFISGDSCHLGRLDGLRCLSKPWRPSDLTQLVQDLKTEFLELSAAKLSDEWDRLDLLASQELTRMTRDQKEAKELMAQFEAIRGDNVDDDQRGNK